MHKSIEKLYIDLVNFNETCEKKQLIQPLNYFFFKDLFTYLSHPIDVQPRLGILTINFNANQ